MIQCPYCSFEISDSATLARCPNCGQVLRRDLFTDQSSNSLIHRYSQDVWQILTSPTLFFRRMPVSGGISGPLAFALVTHWVGSALAFLWNLLIGGLISKYFGGLFDMAGDVADVDHPGRSSAILELREKFVHWFWGAGSVITDPFVTVVSILFTSFFVYLGARLLIHDHHEERPQITFESAARIICFGMTPAILAVFPVVGAAIGSLMVVIVTIIGTREVYRVSSGRAVAIALFPKLLFAGIILLGFITLATFMVKFLSGFFW